VVLLASPSILENAYKSDRKHLFLPNLHDLQHGEASGVSSFAIRVSVYYAFFDRRLSAGKAQKGPLGGHARIFSGHTDENKDKRSSQVQSLPSTIQEQQDTVGTLITTLGTSEIQVMPPINEGVTEIPTSGELQTLPTAVSDTDMIVGETHTQNRGIANT
jgi:hypothetical protein